MFPLYKYNNIHPISIFARIYDGGPNLNFCSDHLQATLRWNNSFTKRRSSVHPHRPHIASIQSLAPHPHPRPHIANPPAAPHSHSSNPHDDTSIAMVFVPPLLALRRPEESCTDRTAPSSSSSSAASRPLRRSKLLLSAGAALLSSSGCFFPNGGLGPSLVAAEDLQFGESTGENLYRSTNKDFKALFEHFPTGFFAKFMVPWSAQCQKWGPFFKEAARKGRVRGGVGLGWKQGSFLLRLVKISLSDRPA